MKETLLNLFPLQKRELWKALAEREGELQEIRLRLHKPIIVILNGQERFLSQEGVMTDKLSDAYIATSKDLEEMLSHLCKDSVYAFSDEIRQGFLTVSGGHRIGIAGQVVLSEEGTIRTIKHIAYMNIRIAHEVKGAADRLMSRIYKHDGIKNTLIISPPGCGKTTILRDLIRQVSDGTIHREGLRVGVVDERSELAGSYLGTPQNDLGIRTDVLDGCPKVQGMMMLLRTMAPQVIALDELGNSTELEALRVAAACGSSILATIHGADLKDVTRKIGLTNILENRMFELFVVLGKRAGQCCVLSICEGGEIYDEIGRCSTYHYGMCGFGDMEAKSFARAGTSLA